MRLLTIFPIAISRNWFPGGELQASADLLSFDAQRSIVDNFITYLRVGLPLSSTTTSHRMQKSNLTSIETWPWSTGPRRWLDDITTCCGASETYYQICPERCRREQGRLNTEVEIALRASIAELAWVWHVWNGTVCHAWKRLHFLLFL